MNRNEKITRATQAAQLQDYPAFAWAYDDVKDRIISELESHRFDGTEASKQRGLLLIQDLQALNKIHGRLKDAIDSHKQTVERSERKARIV